MNNVHEEITGIIDILESQKKLHKAIFELSQEKRQVITRADTDRLNDIVMEELKLLNSVKKLEKERVTLVAALAAKTDMQIPEGDVTISAIAEIASAGEQVKLSLLQKELGGLMRSQQEINALNRELLETQLEYTDVMLNLFVGDVDPINNLYSGDGKKDQERRKTAGLFDTQI